MWLCRRRFADLMCLCLIGCSGKTDVGSRNAGDQPGMVVSDAPGPESSPEIAESEFVYRYARAHCSVTDDCCVRERYARANSTCETAIATPLQGDIDAAKALGARYDGAAAASCVASLQKIVEHCTSAKAARELTACDRVYFGGGRTLGSFCSSPWECGSTANERRGCSALMQDGGLVRRCERNETVALGEPCSTVPNIGHICTGSSMCLADADGGTICTARALLGAHCFGGRFFDMCVEGASCQGETDTTETCTLAKKPGELCTVGGTECEDLGCQEGRCVESLVVWYLACSNP